MKTTIINILKNLKLNFNIKKAGIIIIIITATLISGAIIYNQHIQIEKTKQELLENQLTDDQKSLVEYEKKKKENIDSLNTLKNEISERIKKTETIEKLQECYDNQVDRIMNGKDTDEEYCEELLREEEQNEYKAKVDQAKNNCYEQKANKNLSGEDLVNFCENPDRLGEFETSYEEPQAPQHDSSKEHAEVENLDKKQYSAYRWEWNDKRNDWISYLYEKSGYDKDMVLTFLSENDNMGLNRPSNKTGFDGNRAYGICQLYYRYHKNFIDSQEFQDPYKQMDYCIEVWKDAKSRGIIETTFYAYNFRYNAKKKLIFTI